MFFYVDWNIKMATITVIKKINRTQWDNIIFIEITIVVLLKPTYTYVFIGSWWTMHNLQLVEGDPYLVEWEASKPLVLMVG